METPKCVCLNIVYPHINSSFLFSKVEDGNFLQKRMGPLMHKHHHRSRSHIFPATWFWFGPRTCRGSHGRSARSNGFSAGAMFTPLMASAAGYAATAYFYNLGRFKFDAEQRQDCIYQIQNMRLVPGLKGVTCWGLVILAIPYVMIINNDYNYTMAIMSTIIIMIIMAILW